MQINTHADLKIPVLALKVKGGSIHVSHAEYNWTPVRPHQAGVDTSKAFAVIFIRVREQSHHPPMMEVPPELRTIEIKIKISKVER